MSKPTPEQIRTAEIIDALASGILAASIEEKDRELEFALRRMVGDRFNDCLSYAANRRQAGPLQ